jgi:hypothetical protein
LLNTDSCRKFIREEANINYIVEGCLVLSHRNGGQRESRRISKNMLLLVYEPALFLAIKVGIAILWNLAIIVPCPMVKHIYDTRSLLGLGSALSRAVKPN